MAVAFIPGLVAVLVMALVALGLFLWGRWVGRRRGGLWRHLAWLPLAALVLSLIGVTVSTSYMVRALGAVASADAVEKAAMLAANISEAMNCTALFTLPAWLLWAVSLVLFLVGSVLRPAARR